MRDFDVDRIWFLHVDRDLTRDRDFVRDLHGVRKCLLSRVLDIFSPRELDKAWLLQQGKVFLSSLPVELALGRGLFFSTVMGYGFLNGTFTSWLMTRVLTFLCGIPKLVCT